MEPRKFIVQLLFFLLVLQVPAKAWSNLSLSKCHHEELGTRPTEHLNLPFSWLVLASLGSSFPYYLSFSSHEQKTTRSSGLFPPLILSKMGVEMENFFSGSFHINSFGDIKETPKGVEKQLEWENGRDQNRVTQAYKKAG